MALKKLLSLFLVAVILSACTQQEIYQNAMVDEAKVTDRTRAGDLLLSLPAPSEKVAVALYDFQDQTGQFKNNEKFSEFSSAVTKGGHAILTKALLDAGTKKWFTVIERGGLKDLIQERQIIKMMRSEYHPNGEQLPDLPPLVYGGMLIEGGIVSYDSNVITGGAGATYLGIGGNVQYHRDLVTIYLRAVSIQSGEVLLSVTSSKTIFSTAVNSNVLKYITFDKLLQAEAGFTVNEPTQLCVRQAIEAGVYSLVMEGAIDKLWDFRDPAAGQQAIAEYIARRDGTPVPPSTLVQVQPVAPLPAPVAQQSAVQPVAQPVAQPAVQTSQAVPVQSVQQANLAPKPVSAAMMVVKQASAIQQQQYQQQPVQQAVAQQAQARPREIQQASNETDRVAIVPMSASITMPANRAQGQDPVNSAVGYGYARASADERRRFDQNPSQ